MAKQQAISLSEYTCPNSMSTELQVLADMVSLPETMMDVTRMLTADMFNEDRCRDAFIAITKMHKEGQTIDLPSIWGKVDGDIVTKGIIPMMSNVGSSVSALQHYASLKEFYIKRQCYHKAVEWLIDSSRTNVSALELIGKVSSFADKISKEACGEKNMQHISEVLQELGDQLEERETLKAQGKALRVPTGIYTLDYLTYGGFNAGNLVILAARPSVGKTAVMLQMARAAAMSGKAVNLFNLEMTNTELAQRMLFSTGRVTPLQLARGEVEWSNFEIAAGQFSGRPIYMNDVASTTDEIVSRITLNAQMGKCDIAFIDYLGLIRMGVGNAPLYQAIAETTKQLKQTAKACGIPIVLLCQLNRTSASENRAPMMHDLRDSGSIEQDADIILMLERSAGQENEVNIWVRKNRQGKAGDIKVEIVANETFTSFTDKNEPPVPPDPISQIGYVCVKATAGEHDFFQDNNQDFPF